MFNAYICQRIRPKKLNYVNIWVVSGNFNMSSTNQKNKKVANDGQTKHKVHTIFNVNTENAMK